MLPSILIFGRRWRIRKLITGSWIRSPTSASLIARDAGSKNRVAGSGSAIVDEEDETLSPAVTVVGDEEEGARIAGIAGSRRCRQRRVAVKIDLGSLPRRRFSGRLRSAIRGFVGGGFAGSH
ncbi:hypothetical protein ACLOJK_035002 [Asimina triloba]